MFREGDKVTVRGYSGAWQVASTDELGLVALVGTTTGANLRVPLDAVRLASKRKPYGLFWVDLETTGLDPHSDSIIEIAYVFLPFGVPPSKGFGMSFLVTNSGSEALRQGALKKEVQEMHEKSGLAADHRSGVGTSGPTGSGSAFGQGLLNNSELASTLLDLSSEWPTEDKDEKVVVAGSSAHFDLGFLRVHVPSFAKRLSHRVFDTSAIEMFARTCGYEPPDRGEAKHRATDDVLGSMRIAHEIANWVTSL